MLEPGHVVQHRDCLLGNVEAADADDLAQVDLIVMLFKPIMDAGKEKKGIVKEFKHDGGHLNENLGAALNA
jgi:hypothetical protein